MPTPTMEMSNGVCGGASDFCCTARFKLTQRIPIGNSGTTTFLYEMAIWVSCFFKQMVSIGSGIARCNYQGV
jgi:hypothetical protein